MKPKDPVVKENVVGPVYKIKCDRIKRKSIINQIEKGGLNMIDVRSQFSAIKASWVGRIVNAPNDHLWAYLPKRYLSKFGENYLIVKSTFTSLRMFPLLKRIPQFYQDIVLSYIKSKVIQYEVQLSSRSL